MTDPAQPLTGKVALVTGASRGLGRGIAEVLAEQGADIVVNYRTRADEAESVVDRIEQMGRRAVAVGADVSQADQVRDLFQSVDESFDALDILVNNAGTTQPRDIFEETLDDWRRILDTNLTSCFLCSRQAMRRMRSRGGGRIVNIGSIVGHRGAMFGHVHYAATKSGMLGVTKTLARTGAALGINVNCVAPGLVETEMLVDTHGEQGIAELAETTPLGLGTPRDVGLAVAFLCGEGGRYITGATIDVNGGMYMR